MTTCRHPSRPWALAALALATAAVASWTAGASAGAAPELPEDARAGRTDLEAHALFKAVLRRHAALRDFEAAFTQTAVSRATGEAEPESGTVSYMKPDLWRWDYRTPEKKLVIVRGNTAAVMIEGDEDVSRYELGQDEGGGSSVGSLIAGGEAVAKAFKASFEPLEPPERRGEVALRLDPIDVSEEFDHVMLIVGPRTLGIAEVTVVDPGGNGLRFRFGEFRANKGLSESAFAWPEPPARTPLRRP